MAVRWQLWRLLQEQQPRRAIVLEHQPDPAAAACIPLPPSPPPSSAVPASPPRQRGPLPEETAVFHCRGCWTVLGDSLQLCGQEPLALSILICYRVTSDVVWEDSLLIGLEGALLGCAYYLLSCRSCGMAVGFMLYSSGRDLAYLRGLFCFFKNSIVCYFLRNHIITAASKVYFAPVTIEEQTDRMKKMLVDLSNRINLVMMHLEQLEEIFYATESQDSSSDPDDLMAEYA